MLEEGEEVAIEIDNGLAALLEFPVGALS